MGAPELPLGKGEKKKKVSNILAEGGRLKCARMQLFSNPKKYLK